MNIDKNNTESVNKNNVLKLASLIATYDIWKKHEIPIFSKIIDYILENGLLELSDDDLKKVPSKDIISWVNLIQTIRKELVNSNYILKTGNTSELGKGIWLLTNEGKQHLISLSRIIVDSKIDDWGGTRCTLNLFQRAKQILVENNISIKTQESLEINDELYFNKIEKQLLINQINTAVKMGKHIILVGPPGTGKSKLAKIICNHFAHEYEMVTASSNWSSYEIIGGYKVSKDKELYFDEGIFLKSIKDSKNKNIRNRWLIIDELNRADIDKAFGALFSILTGDKIMLSYEKEGNNVIIRPQYKDEIFDRIEDYEYIVSDKWKLIATMNSYDKASLYEMSYAFMRRFAFIPVEVPKDINSDIIEKFLNIWNIDDIEFNKVRLSDIVSHIWQSINRVRPLGPAIIRDIAKYVNESDGDYTSAIVLFVLPQFEGVQEIEVKKFLKHLFREQQYKQFFDEEYLYEFVKSFLNFDIQLPKDEGEIYGNYTSAGTH